MLEVKKVTDLVRGTFFSVSKASKSAMHARKLTKKANAAPSFFGAAVLRSFQIKLPF